MTDSLRPGPKSAAWLVGMTLVTLIGVVQASSAQDAEVAAPPALKVGDDATGFELEALDGKTVSLAQFQGGEGKSVVLTFVRAHW